MKEVMTMAQNDPAFPIESRTDFYQQGLTKLEWFAGMALNGMLSNRFLTERYSTKGADMAKEAFDYADDMLAESEKRK